MRKVIFFFSWGLLLGGGYFLYRGGSDYWQSIHSQKEAALEWENQNAPAESSDASPVPFTSVSSNRQAVPIGMRNTRRGDSIAKLSIPRLSTVLYVLEGTNDKDLKRGPGHLEGTVMPGADGNCVIAGHRDTHFRVLKDIAKGDVVFLQSRNGIFKYRVSGTSVVSPDNVDSLQPTSKAVLNLVTCFPFNYVGSAPRRFVVHADLIQS